jgi:hypothetical protein
VILLSNYAPSEGVIIPSRNPLTPKWFSSEFFWASNDLTVNAIGAGKIQVGSLLQVGGKNSFGGAAQNGQIAVFDSTSKLVGWIGTAVFDGSAQQTPGSGNIGGAWFGQLWVGGDSPSHAPLYVDGNGVIMVGGIAAAAGAPYPYISVRDNYGIERGRIGAMLSNPPAPGDGGGHPAPSGVVSGAWFTQLAAGGSSATGWQMLIDGSQTPGKFYIRDTDQFTINFAANPNDGAHSAPFNAPYTISMGKGVWAGVGSAGNTWQFPGIQIYEATGNAPSQIFGAVLLNRGLVLRGTPAQNNNVIVSLVMFNGDNLGSDNPPYFWGGLAMYSPTNPGQVTVNLASGSSSSGDATFYLNDHNGTQNFGVTGTGDVEFRGALRQGTMLLVDSNGNWKGGGMTAAVTSVNASGAGLSVSPTTGAVTITNTGVVQLTAGTGVFVSSATGYSTISIGQAVGTTNSPTFGSLTVNGTINAAGYYVNPNTLVIDGTGAVVSSVATRTGSVGGASLAVLYNGNWVYGAPLANQLTFRTGDGRTVTVTGGLITNVA